MLLIKIPWVFLIKRATTEKRVYICGKLLWFCWTAKASDHHYWESAKADCFLSELSHIATYWEPLGYPAASPLPSALWICFLFFSFVFVCFWYLKDLYFLSSLVSISLVRDLTKFIWFSNNPRKLKTKTFQRPSLVS